MALTALTLPVLRQKAAAKIGPFLQGTVGSLTTTTVVDAASHKLLRSSGQSSQKWVPSYLLRPAAVTASGVDRLRVVASYNPVTGTLTHGGPVYTDVTATSETYELHPYLDPDDHYSGLLAAINNALTKKLYYRITRCPLTLVPDGDMETSGVTNWTATTLATNAKATTAGTVFWGTQSLHTVTNAANGYDSSDAINVIEQQGYYAEAICRAANATSTPSLIIYDFTNSAVIDTITASDILGGVSDKQMEWISLNVGFTAPSGCKQIKLRLAGTENGADIYWDSVTLLPQAQRQVVLPSWLTAKDLFVGAYWVMGNQPRQFQYQKLPVSSKDIAFGASDADSATIDLGRRATRRLVIDAWRPYTAFTTGASISEAESRTVDEGWALSAIAVEALGLIKAGNCLATYDGDIDRELAEAQAEYLNQTRLNMRKEPRPL
jgi:hypothetical protein